MALNKKIDRSKKAKPAGWRFAGTRKKLGKRYYKRPENELGERALDNYKDKGLVVWENRLGKSDMRQDARFAGGGVIGGLWTKIVNFLNEKI